MFGKLTYAPHKLYLQRQTKVYDEYGNLETVTEDYEYVCECRCDDAGDRDAISVNGERFFPSYHIVSERGVPEGVFVRVLAEDGQERAFGKVIRSSYANYFNLYQAWI